MTDIHRTLNKQWTRKRAILLSAACLTAGIAGGWFIRGSQAPAVTGSTQVDGLSAMGATPAVPAPNPARLKEMADAQAAPLLNKLKSDANNPGLLTNIGNIYYDAQQYPIAVDYYAARS